MYNIFDILIIRVARDLMRTEQSKSGTSRNPPEQEAPGLAGSTQPENTSSQSQIVLESRSLLETGSLEMGLIQNGQVVHFEVFNNKNIVANHL